MAVLIHQPTPAVGVAALPGETVPAPAQRCTRGALASIEGITGVGKSYLTDRAVETLDDKPLILDGFSQRKSDNPRLDRALIHALREASGGDQFLRGGTPKAEALLLLAVKRYDLDTVIPDLAAGRSVIEGRCIDTTAVAHGLLMHPEDPDAALAAALELLDLAAAFRPLPDLTILVTDVCDNALARAQERDQRTFTAEQARFVREAATLYERIAHTAPRRYRIVDRRRLDPHQAAEQVRAWINAARTGLEHVREPWADPASACMYCGLRPDAAPA